MPAVLNAANEFAVSGYLKGRLKFTEIPEIVEAAMEAHQIQSVQTIDDILRADQWAREKAKEIIEQGP